MSLRLLEGLQDPKRKDVQLNPSTGFGTILRSTPFSGITLQKTTHLSFRLSMRITNGGEKIDGAGLGRQKRRLNNGRSKARRRGRWFLMLRSKEAGWLTGKGRDWLVI